MTFNRLFLALLCVSAAIAEPVIIIPKHGQPIKADLLGVHDTIVYYKLPVTGRLQVLSYISIAEIRDLQGNPLAIDYNVNTLSEPIRPVKSTTPPKFHYTRDDLLRAGTGFIIASGALGYWNISRECDDCGLEEAEVFYDNGIRIYKLHYAGMVVGGALMLAGYLTPESAD
ncbi:MAG: hypothetical protein ABIA75_00370 [Candidatus Neomarinimicrobiota bacterium]